MYNYIVFTDVEQAEFYIKNYSHICISAKLGENESSKALPEHLMARHKTSWADPIRAEVRSSRSPQLEPTIMQPASSQVIASSCCREDSTSVDCGR